jgi:hypothetical protein
MSVNAAVESGAKKTCKKCKRVYGELVELEQCKTCDKPFCSNCLSERMECSGSTRCRQCGAALCRKHIARVVCDCKFTPFSAHFMCDHGDIYCSQCVCNAALNESTLVPFKHVDAELRRLRLEIQSLEFKIGVMESDRRIHMRIYHPDDTDGVKKRKT